MATRRRRVSSRHGVKRGEVYLVNFDPTLGVEIQKTRPALVLQNDIDNRFSSLTIVAAITSKVRQPIRPTHVLVEASEAGLTLDSMVLLNQIRSVDKRRLGQRLGKLKPDTMEQVEQALLISLGFVKI